MERTYTFKVEGVECQQETLISYILMKIEFNPDVDGIKGRLEEVSIMH